MKKSTQCQAQACSFALTEYGSSSESSWLRLHRSEMKSAVLPQYYLRITSVLLQYCLSIALGLPQHYFSITSVLLQDYLFILQFYLSIGSVLPQDYLSITSLLP